jgi:hypothetical protein
MPGEFEWLDNLSVEELRLLADGKLESELWIIQSVPLLTIECLRSAGS